MKAPVRSAITMVGATLFLAACGGDTGSKTRSDSATVTDSAAAATQPAGGMENMPGMQGNGMMEQMQGHMKAMETASGDSLKEMIPMHRQMTANMISDMNRQMTEMKMTGDAAWTTTMDSVRRDLTTLPELSGNQLKSFMTAHHSRVARLMEMHQRMMKNMKM